MLPDAEDGPAEAAELAGDVAVAGAVGGELGVPEGPVVLRAGGVTGAAVPEAAVDKDGLGFGSLEGRRVDPSPVQLRAVEVVKVIVCRHQLTTQYLRCSSDPDVVLAHVSGGFELFL